MFKFTSITQENFRKVFLINFTLSCLIPLLIILYLIYQHTIPVLTETQITRLTGVYDLGIIGIFAIQVFGFFLLWRWTGFLERLTAELATLSRERLGDAGDLAEEAGNELIKLGTLFRRMGDELQRKIMEANETTTKMKQLTQKLSILASTDELTGLFNRRWFHQKLEEVSRRATELRRPAWLIRFEINGFHNFSDKVGDTVLRQVGLLVKDRLPNYATPFRIGRNEFALIVSETDGKTTASLTHELAMRIKGHDFLDTAGAPLGEVSISCGIAGYRTDEKVLFEDAGKAMLNAMRMKRPIGVATAT